MLQYTLRIRDLVHGTILFTELEKKVIDHIFFQRLRHIRQNDVAFIVYPSLNTSRFEHALGTCRVAGMIADHLTQSPKWEAYSTSFRRQTGLNTEGEFVQLTRLYALLHDIGHFPLSHLFEIALGKWAKTSGKKDNPIGPAEDWTGVTGFEKLRLNGTFVRLQSDAKQRFDHLHFLIAGKSRMNGYRVFDFRKYAIERVGGVWNIEVRVSLEREQVRQMPFDAVPCAS